MAQEKVTVVATFKSKPGMEKTVKGRDRSFDRPDSG